MNHFHFPWRGLRVYSRHAFACTLVVTVGNEVFSGSCHLIVVLHAAHHFDTQFSNEVRGFSVHFFISSPSLVTTDVEDGGIHIGISQHACFSSGDKSYLADQFPVPRMSQAQLGGEVGGTVTFYAADAFVGEVDGDSEAGLFYEETLHFVQCPGMA